MFSGVLTADADGTVHIVSGYGLLVIPFGRQAYYPVDLALSTTSARTERIEEPRVLHTHFSGAELRNTVAGSQWLVTVAEVEGEVIGSATATEQLPVRLGYVRYTGGETVPASKALLVDGLYNTIDVGRFQGLLVEIHSEGSSTPGATIAVSVSFANYLDTIPAGTTNNWVTPGNGYIYIYPGATPGDTTVTADRNNRVMGYATCNIVTTNSPVMDNDGLTVTVWGLR